MSSCGRARGAARRSGGGRRRLGRLPRFLVQHGDLVGQLRAVAQPMLDARGVELDALLGAGSHRVGATNALAVAAVPGASAVGDEEVVEGMRLGAAAGPGPEER